MQNNKAPVTPFSPYQKIVVAMLAFLQFTIILDFMILAPLGAILMPILNITPGQFGLVVSAYAFSAGASGLLAAGFADRFDRKKLLLFFYTGFVLGTFLCGIAPTYEFLLMARIVTGIFGGVVGSIGFAITTDLFPLQMRGRVMGITQTSFAASQVLGLPLGLFLANTWGWHSPFLLIVGVSAIAGLAIIFKLKPINEHLKLQNTRNPIAHLIETVKTPRYLKAFATTALLSTGGFMLMPFGSAFTVNNVGISLALLPMIYMVTGFSNIIVGPSVGRLADKVGKYRIFVLGSILGVVTVTLYTHMGTTPLWVVMAINVFLFAAITTRMISSSALISAIPDPAHRGSFMSVSSSLQQISGGIAAAIAGKIVVQTASGPLEHYDTLGYIVSGTMLLTMFLMYFIKEAVGEKTA